MQCKDKFLLQSTQVAPHTDIDELPPDIVRIYLRNPCLIFFMSLRNFKFYSLLSGKIVDIAYSLTKRVEEL